MLFGMGFEQGHQNLVFCWWSVESNWSSRRCFRPIGKNRYFSSSGQSKWYDSQSDGCTWN